MSSHSLASSFFRIGLYVAGAVALLLTKEPTQKLIQLKQKYSICLPPCFLLKNLG